MGVGVWDGAHLVLCSWELWSKELGELAVCGSVGTRMRWSGGECGCGSRGKKVSKLFHESKLMFGLLRKQS